MGEVVKAFSKFNLILTNDFFLPKTCEYYLHFDINLPYLEKELKNCIASKDKYALGEKNSYNLQEKSKEKNTLNQGTYKKESLGCNNCPHRPKEIIASQEAKTGKLSRIL